MMNDFMIYNVIKLFVASKTKFVPKLDEDFFLPLTNMATLNKSVSDFHY